METRKQMLQSTYRRHKFEVDSKEILNRLEEKEKSLQDSKDPNQLIFEIETLKDKVSFSEIWVGFGRQKWPAESGENGRPWGIVRFTVLYIKK